MERQFGWIKDKFDKQDYLHRRKFIKLPDVVKHSHLLTPVRDQGQVGSCVGFGIGINLNSVKVMLEIFKEWCSPTYIYNGARYLEGTLPIDMGCQPRDALEWTLDFGILLEHFWPYDPTMVDRNAPSSERIAQANRYKGFQYWRAVDGVDGLCDVLASGYFVSIGTPWFSEWRDAPCGRLAVPTVDSQVLSGHETCLYGYDRVEGIFYGVNSWSEDWGDKGHYLMPFEAIDIFKARGGYDGHYITFTPEEDMSPPPEPTPSPCPFGNGIAGASEKMLNIVPSLAKRTGRFYVSYRNP